MVASDERNEGVEVYEDEIEFDYTYAANDI